MEKRVKKLQSVFVIVVIALAAFFCSAAPYRTAHAEISSGRLIMSMVETHDNERIEIEVRLIRNTGVSAMTLELEYDKEAFDFLDYQKGTALDKLDLMSTNLDEDKTLPIRFNWFSSGREFSNDESTGTILKLGFALKDGAESGKYDIGFKYNEGDISYVYNGNPAAKSAVISKAVVSIADSKISGAEIVSDPIPDEGDKREVNGWLIAGIVTLSVALVALAVVLIVKFKIGKRGKGNWSKV